MLPGAGCMRAVQVCSVVVNPRHKPRACTHPAPAQLCRGLRGAGRAALGCAVQASGGGGVCAVLRGLW